MGMANEGRREITNGASGTPPITDNSSCHTIQEPEPVGERPDPADDGFPSGYEQLRERRIKENLERMQKLGIFQLSVKLNKSSSAPPVKRPWRLKTNREASRHSSRLENVKLGVKLQNVVSLSYKPKVRLPRVRLPRDDLPKANLPKVKLPKAKLPKAKLPKEEAKRRRGRSDLRGKGVKAGPEIYTEEEEKLLGSTELSWTLFVDGYGADRKRIYDPVNGKTCHQCRQKTLGHRTNCCKCRMVQGQFCGDCLYMRYGEHVLEANKNPDWVCPVCRGICNCSLCRNAKGWPPTGTMYKKIAKSGYKSVAHYLVQTKRAPPETESEDEVHKTATPPHSAKRSLTFNDMEVPADGKEESHEKAISEQKLDCRDKENGEFKDEKGVAESGISLNHIKEEDVSSSIPIAGFVASGAGNSCKEPNRDASEGRLKTTGKAGENEAISSDKKLAQETVSEATDKAVSSSEPNAGFVASGAGNSCKKPNRDASEGRLKTTDKDSENEAISSDKKLAQETVSEATDKAVSSSEPNAGFVASGAGNSCKKPNRDASEGRLKTTDKDSENEAISSDKKLAQETVSQATDKAVSSSGPNAGFVASRTRNSCKKAARDASEGRKLETTDKSGENKGCAAKSCRKAKRSALPNAIQDSITRRLRPRINRT